MSLGPARKRAFSRGLSSSVAARCGPLPERSSLSTRKIRFSRVGYEPHEDSVDVGENPLYTLEAALRPRPVQGKGILVEANRYADEREVQTGFVTLDPEALFESELGFFSDFF